MKNVANQDPARTDKKLSNTFMISPNNSYVDILFVDLSEIVLMK